LSPKPNHGENSRGGNPALRQQCRPVVDTQPTRETINRLNVVPAVRPVEQHVSGCGRQARDEVLNCPDAKDKSRRDQARNGCSESRGQRAPSARRREHNRNKNSQVRLDREKPERDAADEWMFFEQQEKCCEQRCGQTAILSRYGVDEHGGRRTSDEGRDAAASRARHCGRVAGKRSRDPSKKSRQKRQRRQGSGEKEKMGRIVPQQVVAEFVADRGLLGRVQQVRIVGSTRTSLQRGRSGKPKHEKIRDPGPSACVQNPGVSAKHELKIGTVGGRYANGREYRNLSQFLGAAVIHICETLCQCDSPARTMADTLPTIQRERAAQPGRRSRQPRWGPPAPRRHPARTPE